MIFMDYMIPIVNKISTWVSENKEPCKEWSKSCLGCGWNYVWGPFQPFSTVLLNYFKNPLKIVQIAQRLLGTLQ